MFVQIELANGRRLFVNTDNIESIERRNEFLIDVNMCGDESFVVIANIDDFIRTLSLHCTVCSFIQAEDCE